MILELLADLGLERSPAAERGLVTWAGVIVLFACFTLWVARLRGGFLRAASAETTNSRGWPFMRTTLVSAVQLAIGVLVVYGAAKLTERRPARPPGWHLVAPPDEASTLAHFAERIWAGGRAGLFALDPANLSLVQVPALVSRDLRGVRALLVHEGALLIACRQGLFRFRDHRLEAVAPPSAAELGPATALYLTRDGSIWIGVTNGAWRVQPSWEKWDFFSVAHGLALPSVDVIYEDRTGVLWFGSNVPEAPGVFRLDPSAERFVNVSAGLPNPAVNAFIEDATGTFWIATGFAARGGAARLRGERWEQAIEIPDLANQKIRSLFRDGQGRLWFCSEYDGVAIRSGEAWKRVTLRDGLPGSEVKTMLETVDGTLWLATERGVGVLRSRP
jgi:ligand-binding sensor domain-containing protein